MRKVLDCRDWVWECFFVNSLGLDPFWPFCFLRSWNTREEPLWTKSKLPKTLGLAKPWTLSKRPQARSRRSSLSRPCQPERAAHSSSQSHYKSTKTTTTGALEGPASGLSSGGQDKRQECRLEVKFFGVFHSFWCDPFQMGEKVIPGLCWILTSQTALLKATFWYLHTFTLYMTRC